MMQTGTWKRFLRIGLLFVVVLLGVWQIVFANRPSVLEKDLYSLTPILHKMHQRAVAGLWDETDEAMYAVMAAVTPGLDALRADAFAADSPHYADVINACTDTRAVATYTPGYLSYGRCTTDLPLLTPAEITTVWRAKLQDDALRVSVTAAPSQSDPRYFLTLSSAHFQMSIIADAVTGQFLGWPGNRLDVDSGITDPLPDLDVQALLPLLLDPQANYAVTQTVDSREKSVYTFTPLYPTQATSSATGGYPVRLFPHEYFTPTLEYDKQTCQIILQVRDGKLPSSAAELGEAVLQRSLSQAIALAQQTQPELTRDFFASGSYTCAETAWLYCPATCDYQLAYFLTAENHYLAVFANTGLVATPSPD